MRLHLIAVGRLKAGPELTLVEDYVTRCTRAARPLGLGPVTVREVEARKGGGMAAEAELLRKALPAGAKLCVLDERGRVETSPDFAQRLSTWQDQGVRDLALMIGGADGLDPGLRAEADFALSFGKMVWPHMLVRVMLAEQVFRAVSILSGSPYHRT